MRLFWTLLIILLTFGFSPTKAKQPEVGTLTDTIPFGRGQLSWDAMLDGIGVDDPSSAAHTPRLVLAQAQDDSGAEPELEGVPVSAERESILVEVGVRIHQITGIDQKSENFGVVGDLKMLFQLPKLGFDPESCDCTSKIMRADELVALAKASGTTWPEFYIYNRQGRVFYDAQVATIEPDGSVNYFERFSATLQAPDFDFLHYPFDQQEFYLRVLSYFPEEFFVFRELEGWSGLGEQLGEEEWQSSNFQTEISAISIQDTSSLHSMVSFKFEGARHITYYIFRIFVPIFIVILVSWFIFFLRDYSKRIDIATTNLLLFIAFNFVISGDLPRLGYLTFLDAMLVSTFVMTGLIVIFNVYLRRVEMNERTDLARTIDRYVLWWYPISYVLGVGAVASLFFA